MRDSSSVIYPSTKTASVLTREMSHEEALCKGSLLRHHGSRKWEKILERLKKQKVKLQKYHGCNCLLLKVNNSALVSEIKLETRHLAKIKYFEMFSNQIDLPNKWKGKKKDIKNKTKENR